jgi:hypothetical protein
VDIELTLVSHASAYHHDGDGFLSDVGVGLLATPPAEQAGQTFNPLATRPLGELASSDIGQPLVSQLGVESGWASAPAKLSEQSGTLLGTETTIETFAGPTNDGEIALISMARVRHDSDAVLVGDGRTRTLEEGERSQPPGELVSANERREATASFVELLSHVVREPPEDAAETAESRTTAPERTTAPPTTTETPDRPPARIPVEEVPTTFRRRAARFLERAVGDEATWPDGAELGSVAHRVERPDVEDVAYYEFEVEPVGFLVVSTGEHDGPIPHWNSDGRPIGRVLEERAEGGPLARILWVDRLRYVGEDPDGNRIAVRGRAVPRIRNAAALTDVPDAVTAVRYGPKNPIDEDEQVSEDYRGTKLTSENEVDPPGISFAEWESHSQLKENYESSYGPLLADLRKRAAKAWAVYRERGGESRKLGTHRAEREPVLAGQRVAEIDETARDAFRVERVTRESGHGVLAIEPADDTTVGERVTLTLEDDAGTQETVDYRAVDPDDDPATAADHGGGVDRAAALDGDDAFGATRYWAGGSRLQPWFYQYTHQGCAVGCGPVAWAILFAWVDRQAAGGRFNGTWWPRWGIYRQGGGYGADAVCPKNHDKRAAINSNGVRSMIEELNRRVDVFCVGNSGATAPWDMDEARFYLWGRTGTDLEVRYHIAGFPKRQCQRRIAESIRGRAQGKGPTPVVVGTGWLSHYPVAYAYRDDWVDDMKVNNGWGPTHDERTEWIWSKSWFSGETYP